MGTGEQMQNEELTTEGDMENQQHRDSINREEKLEAVIIRWPNRNYQRLNLTETPKYF
jgi:leucyl aminopeptidase (aminopeptidase T)